MPTTGVDDEDDLPDAIQDIDFGGSDPWRNQNSSRGRLGDSSRRRISSNELNLAEIEASDRSHAVVDFGTGSDGEVAPDLTVGALLGTFKRAMPEASEARLLGIAEAAVAQLKAL